MTDRILWLDVETTGLDPARDEIVSIAGITEGPLAVFGRFHLRTRPLDPVEEWPLPATGLTAAEVLSWPHPDDAHEKLLAVIGDERWTLAGHCIRFDAAFLREWFRRRGDGSFDRRFTPEVIDTRETMIEAERCGAVERLADHRLETWAAAYHLDHRPHDAASDVGAARNLYGKLRAAMDRRTGVPNP